MPANLTPEFLKAREWFQTAETTEEKLAALERMLATIPKHKGTDHMQADIKRRIAKLREMQSQRKHTKGAAPEHIDREGAGQVVLVGPPNSGKSSLLAALTNAHPEIADYPYSTVHPLPGMMAFEDVAIQLVDLPPLAPDYTEPWVYNLVRSCDLALLVLDGTRGESLVQEARGALSLLEGRRICLANDGLDVDDPRMKILPCRIVVTKGDLGTPAGAIDDLSSLFPTLLVSAKTGNGLDALRKEVFQALHIIRVYTKLPGKAPDLAQPYTFLAGSTVRDAVRTVHREFVERLKYVRIWGSGKFDGQQVPADHVLADRDIIEIHLA
jgi:hypothetical protein